LYKSATASDVIFMSLALALPFSIMAGQGNYRFVPTNRSGEALLFDDYMFRVRRQIGAKKYWRCEMPDCRVTAISENLIVTKDPITAAHCHPSEESNVSRNDFRHNVVQKVRAR
jgi:hypothetical protein